MNEAARQRICPDGDRTVVFLIDDFYKFCVELWKEGMAGKSVVIEDIAEPYVVMER